MEEALGQRLEESQENAEAAEAVKSFQTMAKEQLESLRRIPAGLEMRRRSTAIDDSC